MNLLSGYKTLQEAPMAISTIGAVLTKDDA
jgi:hypothetical protein